MTTKEALQVFVRAADMLDSKPKTNADHIRSMSDDDLAYWIMCPYDGSFCDDTEHNCIECTKEWLQQPWEDDDA